MSLSTALIDPPLRGLSDAASPPTWSEVALVHDYLNQRGGAERVVLEMSKMWPSAPIYTSLFRPGSTWPGFEAADVRTTFLDRLPVNRGFRNLFPFYPAAFRSLGEIDADIVISSSSGWAHMVRARPGALHAVYCYTPARWLSGNDHLSTGPRRSGRELAALSARRILRRVDRAAAHRADLYMGISRAVVRRIKAAYGIDAAYVPPPVDTDRFRPTPRGERLLVISRLLPYKNVDVLVRAASTLGVGLDVVGDGPELPRLRALAGPGVHFHGPLPDGEVIELMQSCSAVCVAAEEDFGLVAVEAQAAGKPVVAYGRGGAVETVEHGLTGVLFNDLSDECVAAAFRAVDRLETSSEVIAKGAQRYSIGAFRRRLTCALTSARESV